MVSLFLSFLGICSVCAQCIYLISLQLREIMNGTRPQKVKSAHFHLKKLKNTFFYSGVYKGEGFAPKRPFYSNFRVKVKCRCRFKNVFFCVFLFNVVIGFFICKNTEKIKSIKKIRRSLLHDITIKISIIINIKLSIKKETIRERGRQS